MYILCNQGSIIQQILREGINELSDHSSIETKQEWYHNINSISFLSLE